MAFFTWHLHLIISMKLAHFQELGSSSVSQLQLCGNGCQQGKKRGAEELALREPYV